MRPDKRELHELPYTEIVKIVTLDSDQNAAGGTM